MKTSAEWLKEPAYKGIVVMDPDGWDRLDFERSWNEPISEAEFKGRLMLSTVMFNRSAVRYVRNEARKT